NPSAFRPTPRRTARSSRAPNAFCSRPGEMMNDGVCIARYAMPGGPARQKDQYAGSPARTCVTPAHPPIADSASGNAMANPPSFTASCTTLTRAEVSRPPAAKYTMMTPPPIDPAPRFAASIVEKMRPGPSVRPATKKSPAPRTRRPMYKPIPINASEYTVRTMRWRFTWVGSLALQIARRRNAGRRRCRHDGANDRLRDHVGRQRADRRGVGFADPATGGERKDRVSVRGRVDGSDGARIPGIGHLCDAVGVGLREPR